MLFPFPVYTIGVMVSVPLFLPLFVVLSALCILYMTCILYLYASFIQISLSGNGSLLNQLSS